MLNKRGISPLIATVLILGFTVALAAIIMTWGTSFTKKMQETTEETAQKQIQSAEVIVDVKNYQLVGNSVNMLVENEGSKKIEGFKARVTGSKGTDSFDIGESLDAYGIKSVTFTWDYIKVGAVKGIELLPIILLGGKEFVSANTPAKIEEEDLGDTEDYFFIDLFNIYSEADWSIYPGGDVTNVNGEMKMVGKDTGCVWCSNFYSDVYYDRSKKPTLKVDFKVNTVSTDTIFHVGSEGTGSDGGYRRQVIIVRNDRIEAQWYDATAWHYQTLINNPYANTWYTLEIEFDSSGSKIYVYERGESKPSTPQNTITTADWNPKFHFWIYRETGYIDNAMVVYNG